MPKLCHIIVFLLLVSNVSLARSLKILDIPGQMNSHVVDEDALDFGDPLPGRPWYVFSDRSNNQTFTRPGGGSPNAVLDFMEKFWVVEKEGGWLHLAKDEQSVGLNLSNNFTDYGWIQLDKLLL